MAASSKVNASVEQANVSSGWDEARSATSAPSTALKIAEKSPSGITPPELGVGNFQADFYDMKRRVRTYLARGENKCRKAAGVLWRKARLLKYEHPGYLIGAAAAAGVACGLLLRTRRSRRRLERYE
jgi:hypothetical protein